MTEDLEKRLSDITEEEPEENTIPFYLEKGNALYEKDEFRKAIKEYDNAIELDYTNAYAHALKARSAYYMMDKDLIEQECNIALGFDEDCQLAKDILAWLEDDIKDGLYETDCKAANEIVKRLEETDNNPHYRDKPTQ